MTTEDEVGEMARRTMEMLRAAINRHVIAASAEGANSTVVRIGLEACFLALARDYAIPDAEIQRSVEGFAAKIKLELGGLPQGDA